MSLRRIQSACFGLDAYIGITPSRIAEDPRQRHSCGSHIHFQRIRKVLLRTGDH